MSVAVYRLYDQDDALLYVGQSVWPERRIYKHSTKTWGDLIRRAEIDWYETRDEALAVERELLETYQPAHNVQHARYTEHERGNVNCKCVDCAERKKRAVLSRRQKLLGSDPKDHGTLSAYFYYGCRCDPCRETKNSNDRARYRRLRGAA